MSHTKEEIIKMINIDEPDYLSIVDNFDDTDIPILNELSKHPDSSIAAKAISSLGLINSEKTLEGIEYGAKNENPILRISAAQALKNKYKQSFLSEGDSENSNKIKDLINLLADDNDIGVRKFAIKAIENSVPENFKETLKSLNESEQNEGLKKMTEEALKKIK